MKRASLFGVFMALTMVCLSPAVLSAASVLDFESAPDVTMYRSLDSIYSNIYWNTEIFSTAAWDTSVDVDASLNQTGFFWANPDLTNEFAPNYVGGVDIGTVAFADMSYTLGDATVTLYSLASDAAEKQYGFGYVKGGFGLSNGVDSRESYDYTEDPFQTARTGDDTKLWLPGITEAGNTFLVGYVNTWGNVFASTQYTSDVIPAEAIAQYDQLPTLKFSAPVNLESVDVANTSYAALIMKDGSTFGGKFSDNDYYNVKVTGYDENGSVVAEAVQSLAAGTDISSDWQTVDLSNFKNVSSVQFTVETSGGENWGAPSIFAMDNLKVASPEPEPTQTPEPTTWLMLVLGLGFAAIRRFRKRAA